MNENSPLNNFTSTKSNLQKRCIFILLLFVIGAPLLVAQEVSSLEEKYLPEEDLTYELKHQSQPWFLRMKDGADYFQIKEQFDAYFANHQWETSKPRSLGTGWLKSKLFYLDPDGIVQPEPDYLPTEDQFIKKTAFDLPTTRKSGTWTLLGPVNSAHTNYSGQGNHGGYVYLNRIDPTNTRKLFAAFVTGGLWVSNDGGVNWTLTDVGFPDVKYQDIDVCIGNPRYVYALSEKQLLKSTNGGLSWTATSMTDQDNRFPKNSAYDIAVSPTNPNIVIARWADKIFRTTDGGANWIEVNKNLPSYNRCGDCSINSEMLDWSTTETSVVYFLSINNNQQVDVFRSADAGAGFSKIATITLAANVSGKKIVWAKLLLPSSNARSFYVAVGSINEKEPNNLWAQKGVHLYKLDRTTGQIDIPASRINMIGGGDNPPFILNHGDIAMDRMNENRIVVGTYGKDVVYISTDNGRTFNASRERMHSDIRTIDVVNNNVLIGTDGEAVLSNDGGNTNKTVTNSISNHELWGFGSAFKSDIVATGNNHGPVMVKERSGQYEWYNGPGADQGNTDVNPLDDRYLYSQGYDNYRFFRTGVHQMENQSNLLDVGGIYHYFNSIEFHPNKYYTIITHHAGQYPKNNPNLEKWKKSLIKTEDNGNTVSIVKTFNDQVFREKISMKNPNYMYVVVGLENNRLQKTTDAGQSWTDITPPEGFTSRQRNISDIAVSDENPNEIWVTYGGVQRDCKVIKSKDGGKTWVNLTQPILTDFPVTKIIFQRGSNGGVYIGNKSGVYYRNNSMPNWQRLGSGLPMCEIRFMFINYNQGLLKIGTSRGAFSHSLYEHNAPSALIAANTDQVPNSYTRYRTVIQFKDYSVVRNATASWEWSFPGGRPSRSTEENPSVNYAYANGGAYDVVLTVRDRLGQSTHKLPGFIHVHRADQQIMLRNKETKRLLFSAGDHLTVSRGDEGGWLKSPAVVGSDANYYERARWYLIKNTDGTYFILNKETNRYLLSTGEVFKGKGGDEGGWLKSPAVVGADANYYDRAKWFIQKNSDGSFFVINKETKRYLFSTGETFKGKGGEEGGWLNSPDIVGSDANYYERAKWYISGKGAQQL